MLSGVGPTQDLAQIGVHQMVDSPGVGQNLWDHLVASQAWKLRRPEEGYAIGSEKFANPEFSMGLPVEWMIGGSISARAIENGLQKKSADMNCVKQMDASRRHVASIVTYAPIGFTHGYNFPMDGSIITTTTMLFQPDSRGTVTLSSADEKADPIIDPQYCSKVQDMVILREGVREVLAAMESGAMSEFLEGEYPPDGLPKITSASPDEEIDRRVANFSGVMHHPCGTASLGTVVDSELRVKGTKRLRVIDASVFPSPISCTPQATVYAVAEMAAENLANGEWT